MDAFMDYLHENSEKMNSEIYKQLNAKIMAVNTEAKEAQASARLYKIKLLDFQYNVFHEDNDGDKVLDSSTSIINIILPEKHIYPHPDNIEFNLEDIKKKIGFSVQYRNQPDDDEGGNAFPYLMYDMGFLSAHRYEGDDDIPTLIIPFVRYRLLAIEPLDN